MCGEKSALLAFMCGSNLQYNANFALHMEGSNVDFAPHIEGSHSDFAPHMEQRYISATEIWLKSNFF